jgi:hypothetical protein
MARVCIFCGAAADSHEDVWPCWLTSRFVAPGTMETERGPDLQMKTWRVNRPEIAIRCVCARCNNGWMSQLQGSAKPLIEGLWDGAACTLDVDACRSLSSWAIMTSMVLQTLGEQENWLYSELDRTLMWKNRRIPSFTGIWIAQCIGHTETYSRSQSLWTGGSRNAERQARGNATTMAFGTLAVQVLKVVPPPDVIPGREISIAQGRGYWEVCVSKIIEAKSAVPERDRSGDQENSPRRA